MPALAHGYPTAYRGGAGDAGARGFQGAPTPANDNVKPSSPANDNVPQRRDFRSDAVTAAQVYTGVRAAVRIAARLNPWLNAAMLAYDVASLAYRYAGWWYKSGTVLQCPGDGSRFVLSGFIQCQLGGGFTVPTVQTDPQLGAPSGGGLPNWRWTHYGQTIWKPLVGWVRPVGPQMFIPANGRTAAQAVPRWFEPGVRPEFEPSPMPRWAPMLDPWHLPIERPAEDLPPLPFWVSTYRRPNPLRAPQEQSQRGNDLRRWVRPGAPLPAPLRLPPPGPLDPPVIPATGAAGPTIRINFKHGRVSLGPPTPHKRSPPGVGMRERKVMLVAAKKGGALTLYNFATEFEDAMTALWRAVPITERRLPDGYVLRQGVVRKVLRRPTATPQSMLKDITRSIHKGTFDYDKAVDNVVSNEVMDRLFGKVGKLSRDASRKTKRSHGYMLGGVH